MESVPLFLFLPLSSKLASKFTESLSALHAIREKDKDMAQIFADGGISSYRTQERSKSVERFLLHLYFNSAIFMNLLIYRAVTFTKIVKPVVFLEMNLVRIFYFSAFTFCCAWFPIFRGSEMLKAWVEEEDPTLWKRYGLR